MLGIVAVLALAAYGALSYFGADAPSHDDDLAALREALAGGPDLGAGFQQVVYTESGGGVRSPIFAELTGCDAVDAAALRRREDELLREGGANVTAHLHAVYRDAAGTVVDVRLFAFRTAGIAEVYEALLVGPDVRSCGIHLEAREEVVRTGRSVLVATVGSTFAVVPAPPPAEDVDTRAVLERLAERLEIEG